MFPRERIGPALAAVLEGLKLARRELEGSAEDSLRRRWVPVGLIAALQAALSGYESAAPEDACDPSQPEHLAPIALLLRRARSQDYLNLPERLELSGHTMRDIDAVIDARNRVLHALGEGEEPPANAAFRSVLRVVRYACLDHPAFPVAQHAVMLALIRDEISALGRALGQSG
ncbi:MAG: hypothetical protein R3C13_04630 [Hyphomonas sp.]|uniref:hypothetical protein n=1 Tax=Hyphomonas sp. TaxID=87 RepID=UPI003529300A